MGRRGYWTEDRLEHLQNALLTHSPVEIARAWGISRNAINNAIQRHGVEVYVRTLVNAQSGSVLLRPGAGGYRLDELIRDRTKARLAKIPTPEEIASRFLDRRAA